jgi:RND family efflux transporter MFP subunit
LLVVLLLVGAVGGALAWRLMGDDKSASAPPRDLPDVTGVDVASAQAFGQRVPVRGVSVEQDTLWIHVVASGQAEAFRRSVVATRASGIVMQVIARENQFVQAGDLLVRLDTLEASLDLAQARAALTQARADFEERMLFSGDVLDPIARDERARIIRASSGLEQAEVAVRRAELGMENTQVRAPFAGRVANLHAVEGGFVASGSEVLTLVQLSPIRVDVNVGATELGYLEEGRTARIRFAAIPGEQFVARVASVNPVVDPESGSARVSLVLDNPGERIKPGMFAWASMDARSYPDRILIPREALLERDRRPMVFMASGMDEEGNGFSEWRYVTPGQRNETHVEILLSDETSVLRAGEIVLVDGHHTLAHQVPIRLVDHVAAAGGRPGR